MNGRSPERTVGAPDTARVAMPQRKADDAAGAEIREVATSLAESVRSFRRSLHIRTVDTGSCAVCESEIRLLSAPHYDLHRLGFFFTPSPRHADLLLVTGPVVRGMQLALRKTYDAMPDPKAVVAVGACPLGGVFAPDDWVHGNLDAVLPVDVFVPGCPPSPLALLHGLLVAVGRLRARVTEDPFTSPAAARATADAAAARATADAPPPTASEEHSQPAVTAEAASRSETA